MKLFITSDIHGRFNVLDKMVMFLMEREDIDSIVVCGDICGDYVFTHFSQLEDKQYNDYRKFKNIFKQLNKEVIFILGNHDVFNVDNTDTNYLPHCEINDFNNFISIEYINFLMYGLKREGNEEDMTYRLSKLEINNKSIIVSHIPPYNCLDKSNNGRHYGSKAIRDLIKNKEPVYFFCGHVHDAFGFKKLYNTYVFNAACNENVGRGWIVDIDTGEFEKIVF